jgi:dienelactone hydrolase
MDSALAAGGLPARNALQLRLLETDELQDALAGLTYLRGLPRVDPSRVAVVGHSFGASLTLLLADRDSTVRAVVAFAPAGLSWNRSPELRARLTTAVERMPMHALFLHARNDYSIDGGIELAAAMRRQGRPGRVTIYPAVGRTPDDGHDFIHLQVQDWEPGVFAFLDSLLTPVPVPP